MSPSQVESPAVVEVHNVGGIDDARVELSPGVTVLSGRNATNRTSLLKAVMAVLGSDRTALKGDADEGYVELTLNGETYTRTLERRGDTVVTGGDPYLSDPALGNLFAFLLEDNEARRAVERGDDLREIIMRPVDTDEIQRRIENLRDERERIDDELGELDELDDERTRLEQERATVESQLEDAEAELETKREEIAAADASVEESREEKERLEARLSDLQDERSNLDDLRHRLETERESVESLREEQAEKESELADLPDSPAGEVADVERRLERLRGERNELETTISELQNVVQFNEEMLDGERTEVLGALDDGDDGDDGALTDELLTDGETVTCWTCGSAVETASIEETVERLRTLRSDRFERQRELEAEIDDLKAERRELQETQDRRERLERRVQRIEDEIADREERIESLTADREEAAAAVEELEDEIAELQEGTDDEVLDLHRDANQLEFQIGQYEDELDEIDDRVAEIAARLDERSTLEARREEIQDELEDLRTRVDRVESEAVESFNDHMDNVLDILDYDNIERIWIERRQREVREGRRKVTRSTFDLHIVRSSDGTTYEDTVEHLSESEREVTGLVFALAGYLVHEVYESVPFVLLDSLEAIDSDRIAALVEYLESHADYLVVALLTEDAQALADGYPRVRDISAAESASTD